MGGNCENHPLPDTQNLCTVSLGQRAPENMPGFCTLAGVGGDNQRSIYCGKMSNAGEWGRPDAIDDNCKYNDCNNYQDIGSGCCHSCCGISGSSLRCTRLSFTGDPVTCCFNDVNCLPVIEDNTAQCFSDPTTQQNACADGVAGPNGEFVPNYRNLVSTDCQDVLTQYCTGTLPTDDPNSLEWLDRWTQNTVGLTGLTGMSGSCAYAVMRNIFSIPNAGTGHCFNTDIIPQNNGICNAPQAFDFDAEGYFWAQNLITATIQKYSNQGFELGTLPGFPGYNPFQDFLYNNICCPYPGLCQSGLDVACAPYTAQRISLNPAVSRWCGCHLNDNEYQEYSVKFNIPPECTPMCNRVGTIPIVGINGAAINCTQDICLIDGVTVNLINSQIGGGIDFDQICGNCQGAQCSCIISDTTIDIANSTIGGNVVPVGQGCGVINCTQSNPGSTGPSTISVPCGTTGFNPYAEYDAAVSAAQAEAKKSSIFWTLVAIGAALVVIFLIIFFIAKYRTVPPEISPTTIPQVTPINTSSTTIPRVTPINTTTVPRVTPINSSLQQSTNISQVTPINSSATIPRATPADPSLPQSLITPSVSDSRDNFSTKEDNRNFARQSEKYNSIGSNVFNGPERYRSINN